MLKIKLALKWKMWLGRQFFVTGTVFIFLGLLFLFHGQIEFIDLLFLSIGTPPMVFSILIFRKNFTKWMNSNVG